MFTTRGDSPPYGHVGFHANAIAVTKGETLTRGRFLTSASTFNIDPNGGIFDVNHKKRPRVTQCENPVTCYYK